MDEVILQKIASIEKCIKRVEQEYEWAGSSFATDYTHQDAAILNLQRACEQSIDIANYITRIKKLGIPSTSRESFDLLVRNELITPEIGEQLKKMVGFSNIAIHEYGTLNVDILEHIILNNLKDFKEYCQLVLKLGMDK